MSKEYFCKDCEHNNNGWCPIKKMNGLKKITECKDKKIEGIKDNEETTLCYWLVGDDEEDEGYQEGLKAFERMKEYEIK